MNYHVRVSISQEEQAIDKLFSQELINAICLVIESYDSF